MGQKGGKYTLINLLITELEKLGILSDKECDFAGEYMCGEDVGSARQDLVEGSGIWPAIDVRLSHLVYQGLLILNEKLYEKHSLIFVNSFVGTFNCVFWILHGEKSQVKN